MFSKKLTKILVLALVLVFATTMTALADTRTTKAVKGSAKIDGEIESAWKAAEQVAIDLVTGSPTATAVARTMWDEKNLYILVEVKDDVLDDANANAWEKDSVEIYIDQNNAKTATYEDDDIQFRVNYKNETSSGGAYYEAVKDSIQTAAKTVDGGWMAEVAIPWSTLEAKEGTVIGFDLQINDAKDGSRAGMLKWNDTTDTAWNNTSVFGNLELVGPAALPQTGASFPVYVLYAAAALLLVGGIVLQVRKLALSK